MANLIHKLRQLIRLGSQSKVRDDVKGSADLPELHDVLNDDVVAQLMQMVEKTRDNEYSCEETFALLDEYVELAANQEDLAIIMPLVKHHLELCVDCQQQFEVLLNVIETESSSPTS